MNRVILADDAALIRNALAGLLRQKGFAVLAEVGDAKDLLAAVDASPPDVAVVDIRMPPTHRLEGLHAAMTLRRRHPDVGVLLLSQHVEPHCLASLLSDDARGVGYLLKDRVSGVAEFLDAVRRVAAGGYAIDPEVITLMLRARRQDEQLATLTEREREVLALMAQGLSNQAIGEQLFLTHKTVESHVRNILLRLELPPEPTYHRRVLAVLTYLRIQGTEPSVQAAKPGSPAVGHP